MWSFRVVVLQRTVKSLLKKWNFYHSLQKSLRRACFVSGLITGILLEGGGGGGLLSYAVFVLKKFLYKTLITSFNLHEKHATVYLFKNKPTRPHEVDFNIRNRKKLITKSHVPKRGRGLLEREVG